MGLISGLVDAVVVLFSAVLAVAVPLIDAQTVLPGSLFPAPLVELKKWYSEAYGDYLMAEKPHFFVGIVWVEIAFLWPLSLANIYGILARRPWAATTSLMAGVSVKRSFLAFYAGNMHGRVRPILNKYWGDDQDMRIYRRLPNRVSKNMSYVQHMKSSKFCICPMGYEVNSPRIVEAIYYECVPVIIADNFVLPFDEVLDWSAFSVVVAEQDIPDLKNILLGIPLRRYMSMLYCAKMLQKHFLWHAKPLKYDIFHMILHSIWFNRLNQIQLRQ